MAYDMKWRKLKKQNADMLKTLEQAQRKVREGSSLKERRAAAREALLPKDRVCPVCKRVVLESRRWVRGVMCLKCYRSA